LSFIHESLRKLLNTEEKKRLFGNFFSLSTIQAITYLLPLVTLPYLVRVLGPGKFGLIAFAQVFIQYFTILTDYSFNMSATREISISRDSINKISEIFSAVIIIKLFFAVFYFFVLFIIVSTIPKFMNERLVYLLTFGMVFGNVLFPVWFFQGIENMKYITLLNLFARGIFTILIFVFIKRTSDYIYVPLMNSFGAVTAGTLSLFIVFKNFKLKFRFVSLEIMKLQLKGGWYIFISSISRNIYKISSLFILGLFTSDVIVGYFSISKKLIDAANKFASIVSQTIYPYVSNKLVNSPEQTFIFLKKVGLIIFTFTFLEGLTFLLFSEKIIYMISGEAFEESILILKMLSFVPLITGLNVPAVQILLGSYYDKHFSLIILIGGILNLILGFILIPLFSYVGACLSIIIAELFVTAGLYIVLKRNYAKFRGLSKQPDFTQI